MTARVYRRAESAALIQKQYRSVLDAWPVPKTETPIATRQGETFVIACGPVDGQPVVLLHGSQANSAAWLPDIARWSSRFRLYAVDVIGEPGLSAPSQPDLSGDGHALWLDDVLAGLRLSRTMLVGTSLGGWIALDYANRRPGAVAAMALICPAGIGRQKNFLAKAMPLLLLGPWGKRKIRELVFGPAPAVVPEDLRPFADLMEAIAATVQPRILTLPRLTDEALRNLRLPILTIVGGRDALFDSAETRERLLAHAPDAEVCFIADGYHYLPDQTERVMAFLERVADTGD